MRRRAASGAFNGAAGMVICPQSVLGPMRALSLAAALAVFAATATPVSSTHADGSYEQPLFFEWQNRALPIDV